MRGRRYTYTLLLGDLSTTFLIDTLAYASYPSTGILSKGSTSILAKV